MRRALLLLVCSTSVSAAYADTPTHKEGEYSGVTPGVPQLGENRPAGGRPARPKRPPPKGTLTWIGFEAKDGGAELFFQALEPFELTQHLEGSTLVAHLSLTHLGHNTWRQIDTRYFDNPLAGAVARAVGRSKRSGAGIDVRISFKNPKEAREAAMRTATEADGMFYAYLTLPEGAEH